MTATPRQVVERELGTSLVQQTGPEVQELLADPAARDRLVALQELAWQLLVEPYWVRLSRLLQDDVAHHAAQLAREGLAGVLVSLHRDIRWYDGELVLEGLPGRAAVLTALADRASTTQLSVALKLSPSTVSEHLTALRETGLLDRRRIGHQVRYSRTPLGDALAGGPDE